MRLQPGQSMPVDKPHEGEEFGYVLDGKIQVHYGDEKYTVRKGDSFIFPANRKHRISSACKRFRPFYGSAAPQAFKEDVNEGCDTAAGFRQQII